jgi:hypothetical protein
MKKALFLLVIGAVLVSALFLGCNFFEPPKIFESPKVVESTPTNNADTAYLERKDALALKHLQVNYLSEETLASHVMGFINASSTLQDSSTSSLQARTVTGQNVQHSRAIVITNTTRLTHYVETGFAETTADKRSARSVIGPSQIPFYVFTLEDQDTGKTGFALTSGDNRIGDVLAVVEDGNYDDDNPGLGVFYALLEVYIENTISIYNSITHADVESALNRRNAARYNVPDVPVSDVGKYDFNPVPDTCNLLPTVRWHQNDPYNEVVTDVGKLGKLPPYYLVPPTGHHYITGCGPVAIAQVMANISMKMINEGKPAPWSKSNMPGYTHVEYDWLAMTNVTENPSALTPDARKAAVEAIGVLMYEIGFYTKAKYTLGRIGTNEASTGIFRYDDRIAFINMGYLDPGDFRKYDLEVVKNSIDANKPVVVAGYSSYKTETATYTFGITSTSTSYGEGHQWVIDGYQQFSVTVKIDKSLTAWKEYPDYVHCNLGWRNYSGNGWYISGVFDTNYVPVPTRSSSPGFYQWKVEILTDITPK